MCSRRSPLFLTLTASASFARGRGRLIDFPLPLRYTHHEPLSQKSDTHHALENTSPAERGIFCSCHRGGGGDADRTRILGSCPIFSIVGSLCSGCRRNTRWSDYLDRCPLAGGRGPSPGEEVYVHTHAYSSNGIAGIELTVDGQPFSAEAPSPAGGDLVTLQQTWIATTPGMHASDGGLQQRWRRQQPGGRDDRSARAGSPGARLGAAGDHAIRRAADHNRHCAHCTHHRGAGPEASISSSMRTMSSYPPGNAPSCAGRCRTPSVSRWTAPRSGTRTRARCARSRRPASHCEPRRKVVNVLKTRQVRRSAPAPPPPPPPQDTTWRSSPICRASPRRH